MPIETKDPGEFGAAEQHEWQVPSWILIVAWGWAGVAAVVAISQIPDATGDARPVVAVLSVMLPAAAVLAAVVLRRGHRAGAAGLLVLSAATPAYFFYVLNIIPLGLAIMIGVNARHAALQGNE